MPIDIFGKRGGGGGPSNEDIEREAARELERLTRGPGPMGGAGMMGAPMAGGGMPGLGGPPSPLEQMAATVQQSRQPVRRRRKGSSLQRTEPEDRAGFKGGGFLGAAANTGSVGSALGFGGGAPPGGRAAPPPPDAQPLRKYAQQDEDDDEDIGVTEMALRDHAERFGRGMEDTMIRSDPAMAESMREQALRQFMERQSGRSGPSAPAAGGAGGGRLRMRSGPRSSPLAARLRPADEHDEFEDEEAVEPTEPQDFEALPEDEQTLDEEELGEELEQAEGPAATPVGDDRRARLAEERAVVAEDRARVAEDRARLAEERASYAEARAWAAEQAAKEARDRTEELEAQLAEAERRAQEAEARAEEVERRAEQAAAPPPVAEEKPRRTRKPPAAKPAKAPPAKKETEARATKAAKSAKAPAKAAKTAKSAAPRKRTPPAPAGAPAEGDGGNEDTGPPPLGGVLGRRLAAQSPSQPDGQPRRAVKKVAKRR